MNTQIKNDNIMRSSPLIITDATQLDELVGFIHDEYFELDDISYQKTDKLDSRKIAEFLSKDGQLLLPFLDLICNTEQAVDELIDVVGKAAIESVLLLSAQQIAGPKQPGRITGDIGWHGRQQGVVSLSERKLRIEKPRLRKKGKGVGKEVAIPAYNAMVMNSRLGSRILEILM